MMWIISILLFWLATGILSIGFDFAYFQRKYPSLRKQQFAWDQQSCLIAILGGPFGILIVFFLPGNNPAKFYGWLWPWSEKARIEAGFEE